MPFSPELAAAYENAQYVVFAARDLVLKVGKASRELDELLEFHGAETAAFVTAANPRGARRSGERNAAAAAALGDLVAAAGYPRYMGEGRDPRGEWPAEPSLLVVGIYRENALALGRLFEQNAIVFVERGKAPELMFIDP
jgi:hypothetical protein